VGLKRVKNLIANKTAEDVVASAKSMITEVTTGARTMFSSPAYATLVA